MPLSLMVDGEYQAEFATNSGWIEFIDWVESLDEHKILKAFVENGEGETEQVIPDLQIAIENAPDEVLQIGRVLLRAEGEFISVWDGIETIPDEEEEDTEDTGDSKEDTQNTKSTEDVHKTELIKAIQPIVQQPDIILRPEITINIPKQDAPIINVTMPDIAAPIVNLPEIRVEAPIVNIETPPAPEVYIENKIHAPKKKTVRLIKADGSVIQGEVDSS